MSTGLVFLRISRVVDQRPRPPGIVIPFTQLTMANVFQCIGPITPIVVDDPNDGGVVGHFQTGEENCEWATGPCLDDLLGRGWSFL